MTTTYTIGIELPSLLSALKIVTPFASKDGTLPVLNTVHFRMSDAETLIMEATDRYRLIEYPLTVSKVEDWEHVPSVMVPLTFINELMTSIPKEWRRAGAMLEKANIAITDEPVPNFSLQIAGWERALTQETRCVDGDYPRVSRLFPMDLEPESPNGVRLNPRLLMEMLKPLPRDCSVKVHTGRDLQKPVVFTFHDSDGEQFARSLLMPHRQFS